MATIKSYSDISQSKKLAEILPIKSADMRYVPFGDTHPWIWDEEVKLLENGAIPCWSLASLLGVLPEEVSLNSFKDGNWNAMVQQNGKMIYSDAGNPINACYELILKLNELNLL